MKKFFSSVLFFVIAVGVFKVATSACVPVLLRDFGFGKEASAVNLGKIFEKRAESAAKRVVKKSAKSSERIRKLRDRYEQALKDAYHDFLQELEQIRKSESLKIGHATDSAVDAFKSVSYCMRIVKAYTLDHFTDESSAEQLISDGLGTGYYHSLFEARDALIASVTRFTERLEAARVQFANDVTGTLTLEGIPCDETIRPFLNDAAARIEESKTNLRIDEVVNGICLSFDAVAIRKIYVTTASILGKITARQAASLTTGVGCCAVDGPLPIGDCVAVLVFVGGTAWSIYDIYEVVSILPNEMKVTLNEITEEFINRSLEEVKSVGELRYRNYRKLCSLD